MEKENYEFQTKHNRRSIAKITLKVVFIIIALKIALSLVATPKVHTDYILAYNNFSKPLNYQPAQNAWNDYQAAFDVYLDINDYIAKYVKRSDSDKILKINSTQRTKDISPAIKEYLAHWLSLNEKAIELANLGARKPYFWYEYKNSNCMLRCVKKPYNCELAELNELLLCKAKLDSMNDDYSSAFKNLLSAYRIGMHLTKENRFIRDQVTGLNCKKQTARCAATIIENEGINSKELESLQNSLTEILANDNYIPSMEIEDVLFNETLEWLFLDWKWGFNSISFRSLFYWKCPSSTHCCSWIHSFVGPTQTQVRKQEKRLKYLYEKIKNTTPWQRQNEFAQNVKEIHSILHSNIYWREFGYGSLSLYDRYQETKMEFSRLITNIAIKHFNIAQNRFPKDLDELVAEHYIKQIPLYPFNGEPLHYDGNSQITN